MRYQALKHVLFAMFALPFLTIQSAAAQTRHGPTASTSTPVGGPPLPTAVHETSKGVFIDPLITEHAFVDRKVRSDFGFRLLRGEEGRLYENEFIFEYAFTRWFSLEFVQPFLLLDPEEMGSSGGIGDIGVGAKFQLTRADETGGFIVSAGVETSLPSGEEDIGAGEEYVVAPLAAVDWAIGSGLFKLQSQGELEIAFPRETGDGDAEAIEWNTALSYFGSEAVVPILELNTEFEGLGEEETASIYSLTPGVVVSLKDIAGKSFDIAAGAQIFFGDDREEDVAFLVSLRHHWRLLGTMSGVTPHAH